MTKWEYATVYTGVSVDKHWHFFETKEAHIEQWLRARYPEADIVKNRFTTDRVLVLNRKEQREMCEALLDWLLSEGWEPFAVDGRTLHLRRRIES